MGLGMYGISPCMLCWFLMLSGGVPWQRAWPGWEPGHMARVLSWHICTIPHSVLSYIEICIDYSGKWKNAHGGPVEGSKNSPKIILGFLDHIDQ